MPKSFNPPPAPSCLARVTGELTMTFPAGIVRVFSGTPPPPVLSFRLVHTAPIEHFQPNADLLFRYFWRKGNRVRGSHRLVGARSSLALICCVALGKSLSLSEPHFPSLLCFSSSSPSL